MTDIWPTIHAERRALADDLAGLDDAAWRTPSGCAEWTVHDVLAHLLSAAKMTPPKFGRRTSKAPCWRGSLCASLEELRNPEQRHAKAFVVPSACWLSIPQISEHFHWAPAPSLKMVKWSAPLNGAAELLKSILMT